MIPPSLTVGYVPGATPAKWARIWAERHPETTLDLRTVTAAEAADAVRAGTVDVALLRLPADTSGLAVISLYEETTVVVVPADHPPVLRLRAAMDLVIGLTACSAYASNGGSFKPIDYRIE